MQPKVRVTPIYYPKAPATAHAVHLVSFNSLQELVPPDTDFESLFTGRANPFVESPAGIACHNGNLYICDKGPNVVHVWPLDGQPPSRIGGTDDLQLIEPVDVAAADDGSVFIADAQAGKIVRVTAGGTSSSLAPAGGDAFRPAGVAEHNGMLYVADIATHQVHRFAADGHESDPWGGVGNEAGQFYFPLGVCAAADGRIYVADTFNSRVQVLDGQGSPLLSMGQAGDRYGDMARPRKVAVGPDGVIFVADPDFGCVHLFNDQGQLLMLLGSADDGAVDTGKPVGVAVATDLPESITSLVPGDFDAHYYLFVANSLGEYSLSLYAIGLGHHG